MRTICSSTHVCLFKGSEVWRKAKCCLQFTFSYALSLNASASSYSSIFEIFEHVSFFVCLPFLLLLISLSPSLINICHKTKQLSGLALAEFLLKYFKKLIGTKSKAQVTADVITAELVSIDLRRSLRRLSATRAARKFQSLPVGMTTISKVKYSLLRVTGNSTTINSHFSTAEQV